MLRSLRRTMFPHWTDHWPEIVSAAQSMRTLHIGSGMTPLLGAVTLDANPKAQPSFVADLNKRPWPLASSSFDQVVALSIIEHLDDVLETMGEIHRISRSGARVHILVPHFSASAAYVDPTHKQRFSARSLDYCISGTDIEAEFGFYVSFRFRQIRRHVDLVSGLRYLPGAGWFANSCDRLWEDYLCYVLRGGGVFWELEVVK